MDQNKFEYFVANYRATEEDELLELGSRAASLAEEAEAALRKVAAERGLELRAQDHVAPRPTPREVEEAAYSPETAELIHIRKVRFLWSLPLALAAGFLFAIAAEPAKGTAFGPLVALIGLCAFVWPLVCLYKLTRAVDPKRSVAWAMVAASFLPIIGWIAPISLVLKAGRIRKASNASANVGNVKAPSIHREA